MPVSQKRKISFDKYRRANLEYFAEKRMETYYKNMTNIEFVEKERERQRIKNLKNYYAKKEFRAFLAILLD